MNIDQKGIDFIVSEETGGRHYYENNIKSTFEWPGGQSGCTAMVGIDIGYYTQAEIDDIFKPLTKPTELSLIQGGRGLKSGAAKQYVHKLTHIIFPWETAEKVFQTRTLPKFTNLASRAYPGVDELPPDAQAAILSLVFNRGVAMRGDTRREMAALRPLVRQKDYTGMAEQVLAMRRLWAKGNGLIGRREREAALIKGCVSA